MSRYFSTFLFMLFIAGIVEATDPCPQDTPAETNACTALELRQLSPSGDTVGVLGMDDLYFYWFQDSQTPEPQVSLLKAPIAGGPSLLLSKEIGMAEPDSSFSGDPPVMNATHLFWSTLEGIYTIPKQGGEATTLYSAEEHQLKVFNLIGDGKYLYWVNNAQEIWQMPMAGGQPKRLIHRQEDIDHLLQAGDQLWWIEHPGKTFRLVSMNQKTGTLHTIPLREELEILAVVADDHFIYLGTMDALKKMPLQGGSLVTLVHDGAEKVICGNSKIFYIPYRGDCGGGHLMKIGKNGGSPEEVSRCPFLRNLLMHEHRLYFLNSKGIGSLSE